MTAAPPSLAEFAQVRTPEEWLAAPSRMSFSRLIELETCPRRWSLRGATYSGMPGGPGYPDRLGKAQLRGVVVHGSIEKIVKALSVAGCPSIENALFVETMREMGGFSPVIESVIEEIIAEQQDNPRMVRSLEALSRWVREQLPDLRQSVQLLVSRLRLEERQGQRAVDPKLRGADGPLPYGSYAELVVRHEEIGWFGIIDLLNIREDGCEIVDFKTGDHREEHERQLQIYSLLWANDRQHNPDRRRVVALTVSYAEGDVTLRPLDEGGLSNLESELAERTKTALDAVIVTPPPARPSREACRICSVRHLCSDYWQPSTQEHLAGDGEAFDSSGAGEFLFDFEIHSLRRCGPRTWEGVVSASRPMAPGTEVQLRISPDDLGAEAILEHATAVRLLDAFLEPPPEEITSKAILGVSKFSEVFSI